MKGKHFKIAMAGKITVGAGIFALLAIALLSTVGFVSTTADAAKSATTTVKVLNTPPQFKTEPMEIIPSSSTTPTTYGNTVSFKVNAFDSSNNGMYLLVCKTSIAPTASSSTAPACDGGASNLIAVTESPVTGTYPTNDDTLVYATSSPINDQINETQAWYAFLCDNETRNPRCSPAPGRQGQAGTDAASPYYINHPYNFSAILNDGPKKPGEALTFTATAAETMKVDNVGGPDSAKLFVCKTNDFDGSKCGVGGTWASSTASAPSNPNAQITFSIPFQDDMYSGYGYIIDNHGAIAEGTEQGKKFSFIVANAAPKVTESSISFASTTMYLTNPLAQTGGFHLNFETTDDNSCQATSTQSEMKSIRVRMARNSVLDTASCKEGSLFDSNSCYNNDVDITTWNLACTPAGCTDNTDTTVNWDCTFPLWSNTDPTDAVTPWAFDGWNASIEVKDDNDATGTQKILAPARYAEVISFPFIELGANTIDFGEFEPGQAPAALGAIPGAVLGIKSQGNTALDLRVSTSDMCPNYNNGCTGNENNNTIFGARQHYATSGVTYWSPLAATGTTSTLSNFDINVKKPTATGTATTKDMHWGIAVPGTLTESGDYKGVNSLELQIDSHLGTW